MILKIAACLSILPTAFAAPARSGLADPVIQPKFEAIVPNPLDPSFQFDTRPGIVEVSVGAGIATTGLVGPDGVTPVDTPIWGYGVDGSYTWPGRTFTAHENVRLEVKWVNNIPKENGYLLTGVEEFEGRSVLDTSLHWAYSLKGYEQFTIDENGTPIVVHLHGAFTESASDGNPEFFFTPDFAIKGPKWEKEVYVYENNHPAASLWYHDHVLGMTRLNVHCGMAGFYFLRDHLDTGKPGNPLNLPAFPYELPLVIQDRFFKENGELFYPAFPGDPDYQGFIVDEGAVLPPELFPDGGPTALAEFFGDTIVVNGKIWPKTDVEPRKYRLRFLNGCDSRFIVMNFMAIKDGMDPQPVEFFLIGGGEGLTGIAERKTKMIISPGDRLDVIIDFSPWRDYRIIQFNEGGDTPFGGIDPNVPPEFIYTDTDKIMAFDVSLPLSNVKDNYVPNVVDTVPPPNPIPVDRVRRLGLFEGTDEFGRLQPLLGTVEPATDKDGNPILWPDTPPYQAVGLAGKQMSGTMTWANPTTENPELNDVEEWEIFNLSADAHPIHVHLVEFEVIRRNVITFDSNAVDGILTGPAAGDGTYLEPQPLVQHKGAIGNGFNVINPTVGEEITASDEYTDNVPTDTVVALPGEAVTIRMKFGKSGRFVWHCHVLSHEDHEMMRVMHVGPLPNGGDGGQGTLSPTTMEPTTMEPTTTPTAFPTAAPTTHDESCKELPEGKSLRIVSQRNGRFVTSTGDNVHQGSTDARENKTWRLARTDGYYYRIVEEESGLSITVDDVTRGWRGDGINIILEDPSYTDYRYDWCFKEREGEGYEIWNRQSWRSWDASMDGSNNILQWGWWGGLNQQFRVEHVDATPTSAPVPSATPTSIPVPSDTPTSVPVSSDAPTSVPEPSEYFFVDWQGTGGKRYSMDGVHWTYSSRTPIDDSLIPDGYTADMFETHRSSPFLTYTINGFEPGSYNKITLGFAEIYDGNCAVGKRLLDITVNGMAFAHGLDIYAKAGCHTPYLEYAILPADNKGSYEIYFAASVEQTMVSTIKVESYSGAKPSDVYVDAYKHHDGSVYQLDGSTTVYSQTRVVTDVQGYSSRRFMSHRSGRSFTYTFPGLEKGQYKVTVGFSETYEGNCAANRRVFDVEVDGAEFVKDLDVYRTAGCRKGYVVSKTLTTESGVIVMDFASSRDQAFVSFVDIEKN